MMKFPIINRLFPSYKWKVAAVIIGGVIVGGGALFMYMLRAHTYLGDDPAACVNCHIMTPYYATWFHSSHARNATCNDCHVPHENAVKKWTFKGMDGMKHVAAFLTKSEPQVIQAHEASSEVIMNNCIRCHTQLNTEFVKTGKIDYMMSQVGELISAAEFFNFSFLISALAEDSSCSACSFCSSSCDIFTCTLSVWVSKSR